MQSCGGCEKAQVHCLARPARSVRIKAVRSVVEQSRVAEQSGKEIRFDYGPDHVWVDFLTPGECDPLVCPGEMSIWILQQLTQIST